MSVRANEATMAVATELLCSVLRLPAGTEVTGVEMVPGDRILRLVVRHPDIPAEAETVCPTFTAAVEFVEWQP